MFPIFIHSPWSTSAWPAESHNITEMNSPLPPEDTASVNAQTEIAAGEEQQRYGRHWVSRALWEHARPRCQESRTMMQAPNKWKPNPVFRRRKHHLTAQSIQTLYVPATCHITEFRTEFFIKYTANENERGSWPIWSLSLNALNEAHV